VPPVQDDASTIRIRIRLLAVGVARRWYCASARHWLHPLALVGGWLAVG